MSKRALVQKEESKPDEKICFIISPIGEEGTPKNIKWKQVRKHIIDPVAEEKGYKTVRADNISKPGKITSQIVDYLRESDLVVADLSDSNPNVFYELGIRDAVRKPVILIRDSHFEIPFDIRDLSVLKYSLDLDEIEESKKELAEYIDAIEDSAFKVVSPVTVALMTPADDISATSQDFFKIILEKINSLERSQALADLLKVRAVALEPVRPIFPRVHSRGLDYQLQSMGINLIDRSPEELKQFEGVIGVACDHLSFIGKVRVNILKGVAWVNYDPVSGVYWLWEYGKESIWYYYDESLDSIA